MIRYFKYASSQYLKWLGVFSTIASILCLLPIPLKNSHKIAVVVGCFSVAFAITFIGALSRKKFKVKTISKSKISFTFGDLFKQKCFVLTTNRHFDVNPTGDWISPHSLIGLFVNRYFNDNIADLESLVQSQLSKIAPGKKDSTGNLYWDYGTTIKINYQNKIIYFVAFTDRNPSNQKDDFYIKAIQKFLKTMVNENHVETISIPIFGANNNISNSGFDGIDTAFNALLSEINNFGIYNQRSELRLQIVTLESNRKELINLLRFYA
jgi:hypothetical protein